MGLALFSLRLFSDNTRAMARVSKVGEAFLTSVRTGIQFVWKEKVLLSSMSLDMFSVLFGGAVAVMPMFADQVLHAGSLALGFLRAAPSVGSALIGVFLAVRPMRTISGRMLLVVVAGFGLSILGFACSHTFWLAFVFLALSGGFDGVSMVIRNTLLQLLTPAAMRGRISALSLIFITSSKTNPRPKGVVVISPHRGLARSCASHNHYSPVQLRLFVLGSKNTRRTYFLAPSLKFAEESESAAFSRPASGKAEAVSDHAHRAWFRNS